MINILLLLMLTVSVSLHQTFKKAFKRGHLPKRLQQMWYDYSQKLYAMGARDFNVTTDDNHVIAGLIIERPLAKRVIVICHGYKRSKEMMANIAQLFDTDSIVMFDFRAHGKSSGEIISFGLHEVSDIKAIVHFIKLHYSLRLLPLIGLGFSMGAATLILAQAQEPLFKALILDSSFATLQQALERGFILKTKLPNWCAAMIQKCAPYVSPIDVQIVNPMESIKSIDAPILLIHSCGDALVPLEHAQLLQNAAKEHKKIWQVNDAIHGAICKMYPEQYKQQIDDFLTSIEKK